MWVWERFACWFGSFSWLLQWRTVARPVNLAQASQSRLGEMKQGGLYTKSRPGDSLNFWASRQLAQARGISLKRDPALLLPLFLALSPRRGGGSPERACLAWARPLSLSEMLGETVLCFGCLMFPEWTMLAEYDCVMMDMYIMEYEIYIWHDSWIVDEWIGMRLGMRNKWMGGLKLKEHGVVMRWDPRLMGRWWSEVWIQNVRRMRDGSHGWVWGCKYVFDILLMLFYECWSVLACNSLGSLGDTSGVALQWSGRNSMAPASGCSWWCPICITR